MKLQGRNAIVTGGSQGLGLELARAFVREGSNVVICAREAATLQHAAFELKVPFEVADVSREDDCARVVNRAISEFGSIHILVNNAGIYGPKGNIEEVDWRDWVRAIEINMFGSVLMCRSVLPHMRQAGYGKIIQLSGGGATNPLPKISAYAASKAAIVRFAETLAEEVRDAHIDVNSIAPGALNTRLLDEALAAGPDKVGQAFYQRAVEQKQKGGAPLDRGADLALFLASAESDGISGKLFSAMWDPWEELSSHREDLDGDVYTLRRIVPKDRGFDWGDR